MQNRECVCTLPKVYHGDINPSHPSENDSAVQNVSHCSVTGCLKKTMYMKQVSTLSTRATVTEAHDESQTHKLYCTTRNAIGIELRAEPCHSHTYTTITESDTEHVQITRITIPILISILISVLISIPLSIPLPIPFSIQIPHTNMLTVRLVDD